MIVQQTQSIDPILHDLVEAWNAHDAARVASFYAPDYVGTDVSVNVEQRGPEVLRRTVQGYLDVFPDLAIRVEEALVCGDRAALKVQVSGTHRGVIMNIPATGRFTAVRGAAFLTFQEGKITHASYLWDLAAFLRGIGLLPDL